MRLVLTQSSLLVNISACFTLLTVLRFPPNFELNQWFKRDSWRWTLHQVDVHGCCVTTSSLVVRSRNWRSPDHWLVIISRDLLSSNHQLVVLSRDWFHLFTSNDICYMQTSTFSHKTGRLSTILLYLYTRRLAGYWISYRLCDFQSALFYYTPTYRLEKLCATPNTHLLFLIH